MTVLKSSINNNSEEFRRNAELMGSLVADLRDKASVITLGGDDRARKKHLERGKLLPRERIRQLQEQALDKMRRALGKDLVT